MTASLVYAVLRQLLQMLTQLARDGDAKDFPDGAGRGPVSEAGEFAVYPAMSQVGFSACVAPKLFQGL